MRFADPPADDPAGGTGRVAERAAHPRADRPDVPRPRSTSPDDDAPAPAVPPVPGEAQAVAAAGGSALSARDREILAFERRWWRHAGAKEQAIRDVFDLSPTRYYQLLNKLLDEPAALAADPVLVGRLRRLRSAGSRHRRR